MLTALRDGRIDRVLLPKALSFRRIRSTLVEKGLNASHSSVSWAASVATRAAELKQQVLEILDEER
ncbi:MAG: hypothetical protein ACRD96_01115 [Bryobacteraceae bacterium]